MSRPSTADQKLGFATSPGLLPGQVGPGLKEAPKPFAHQSNNRKLLSQYVPSLTAGQNRTGSDPVLSEDCLPSLHPGSSEILVE